MENEKKKTKTKRLVILLAMLALIVFMVALGGTTFAKYITSQSVPTQSATVAKWGFVVKADPSELFSTQYGKGEIVATGSEGENNANLDVKASASDNVVAPGTSGKLVIEIFGKAEVDAEVSFKASESTLKVISLTNDADASDKYEPIKWTLNKVENSTTTAMVEYDTLANCIAELVKDENKIVIKAGNTAAVKYELVWMWAFDSNSPAPTTLGTPDATAKATWADNRKDTLLGYVVDGQLTASSANKDYTDVVVNGTKITDNANASSPVTYTAVTTVELALSVEVAQTQVAGA